MPEKTKKDRPDRDSGSYRHMLDLSSASNFRDIMNDLLRETGAVLATEDHRHPCGRSKEKDWTEKKLEDYLRYYPLAGYPGLNERWWIAFGTNRPQWDLICHLNFEGKPGLLLVEAKAHKAEMREEDRKSPAEEKNERSVANDLSIRLRLAETSLGLTTLGLGSFRLSTDHDYQLSNRIAYLHKLASDGVPTVLMYLGWIGSPDWTTDPFATEQEWETAIMGHFERVGPSEFVGPKRDLPTGASLQMVVRSISPDTLQPKPPPPT